MVLLLIHHLVNILKYYHLHIYKFLLLNYLEKKIKKEEIKEEYELDPYFEGFKGEIIKINSKKYLIKGKYEIIGNTVYITELPIGLWTQPYIEYLATFS